MSEPMTQQEIVAAIVRKHPGLTADEVLSLLPTDFSVTMNRTTAQVALSQAKKLGLVTSTVARKGNPARWWSA